VNYTRDREDSEVHVLVAGQSTGSGGQLLTLDFIGRGAFEGLDDRLDLTTRANLAEEQVMTRLARRLQLGLARYIARTTQSDQVRLIPEPTTSEGAVAAVATPEDDPWNFWTFRIGANGFFQGQERQSFLFGNGSVTANRITEAVKVQFSVTANYSESNFDVSDAQTIKSVTRGYSASALLVWSLGEHWGWGGQLSTGHSSFSNEALTVRLSPAVEYNLFPYSESTRRQLRFLYSLGITRLDYTEETIYFKDEETVPDHRFGAALEVRQPWGSSRASFQVVQHLNDLSRHRINFDGGVDLRVFKGLAFNLNGGVARVRDQINLPAGDATEEEVLTRQRELATGFEYNFSVGFSYTFGSIFSSVVNPRFGGQNQFFLRSF
jgi:hypothetical protein